MKLEQLLKGVEIVEWRGSRDVEVTSMAYNTQAIEKGSLFCTWQGQKKDGHEFISEAISKGAVAVVGAKKISSEISVPFIQVKDSRRVMAKIAANFFENPAQKLRVIGATGTNGKTSTTFLIKYLLDRAGIKTGLIGTIHYDLGAGLVEADRTTPESLDLQRYLRTMVNQQCQAVVMEVSSHALDQGRTDYISCEVAIFTNLTQDHLDYHGTMENYFAAKLKLFENLESGHAVLNIDDSWVAKVQDRLVSGVKSHLFGFTSIAGYRAESVSYSDQNTQFTLVCGDKRYPVQTPWLGPFNVANVLAAVATVVAMGIDVSSVVEWLKDAPAVPGRLERVPCQKPFSVIVDYAHSEDAVRKAIQALRPLTKGNLRILIGCGGDRDKTKRPLMARAACKCADDVIFTSDNPRSEDPDAIIKDMLEGVKTYHNFVTIADREEAIRRAINEAKADDVILIAGRGHEPMQEIKSTKYPFSDREVALKILQGGAA